VIASRDPRCISRVQQTCAAGKPEEPNRILSANARFSEAAMVRQQIVQVPFIAPVPHLADACSPDAVLLFPGLDGIHELDSRRDLGPPIQIEQVGAVMTFLKRVTSGLGWSWHYENSRHETCSRHACGKSN
jgi:hypothetical protein